jgi:hypothetical protein
VKFECKITFSYKPQAVIAAVGGARDEVCFLSFSWCKGDPESTRFRQKPALHPPGGCTSLRISVAVGTIPAQATGMPERIVQGEMLPFIVAG